MSNRVNNRIHRAKEKLRRFFTGHEPTTAVNQAPATPEPEPAQVNPPAAQSPPDTVKPHLERPNRNVQTDTTPTVPIPANDLSTASSPRPEPSQVDAASAQGPSAAVVLVSESVNVQCLDPTPVVPNAPEREPREIKNSVWSGVKTLLGVLKESSDAFGPLKSAVSGLSRCIEIFENAAAAREEYAQLRTELNNICQDIFGFFDGNAPLSMTPSIAVLALGIERETEWVVRKSQRNTLERHAEAMEDAEGVLECYRRIQVLLNRLSLNANVNMWKIAEQEATRTRLKELPYSAEAKYKSTESDRLGRNICTPNTRVDVLRQLQIWAGNSDSQRIYWLNGMAGTGKTTIAFSLCEQLQDAGRLAASFFCSRQLPTCRQVSRIIPSIAFQLSAFSLPFRHAMSSALEKQPDAHNQPVDLQFDSLIAAPLREVRDTLPVDLVVVIDALDECEDAGGVSKMLFSLLRSSSDLPIKVFVTSRPEQQILDRMESETLRHLKAELRLHELEHLVVQSDIRTYLEVALHGFNVDVTDLETLTKRAGVLFVYASTVVRYVTSNPARSSSRLTEVLSTPTSLDSSQLGVDPLYAAILQAALEDESLTRSERREAYQVLRTVICAQEPVSVDVIAQFLGMNKVESVSAALRALSSVLQVSGTAKRLVTTLHQSFPDYMLDQQRSGRFCCEPKQHNSWYAQTCFGLLKTANPALNICHLKSSCVPNQEIVDLDGRVDEAILPQLYYACRYWEAHVELAEPSKEVVDQIVCFLSARLLLWMEVMSLKKSLNDGVGMLLKLQAWLQTIKASSEIQELAADALRFLSAYASGPVSRLTPHIYLSTLALWPKQRPISKLYLKGFPHLAGASGTAIDRQSAGALAVLNAPGEVSSVTCSPDGTTIAAGLNDGAIHIWDAYTGEKIGQPLEGHSAWVGCVAYSPDGRRIVSGSYDITIRIWDTRIGQMLGQPLQGHTGGVRSVAYSPDGAHIASGSEDTTIRIWDVQTGQMLGQPLEGHTGIVYAVAYSPNGAHIVSGSKDKTIRVWDAQTGRLRDQPLEGHTDEINSVAYSPNGSYIVSGSDDMTVRIWNAETGQMLTKPLEGHTARVWSVAYSPDGAHIVSGSFDSTICIWDAGTGQMLGQPLRGHTDSVRSVSFSPDGLRIISGSGDKTIRIWDAHIGQASGQPPEGHTGTVCSVAYSPDGAHIASGSGDNTICIWDAYTGQMVGQPLKGHADWVRSVAYSLDGTRVASGSDDRTICIWDASSGKMVGHPLEGHTQAVWSVAFSPDGSRIASGSGDKTVCIWDARTGQMVGQPLKGHTSTVCSVAFSPDGARIVSGSGDWTICIWDANTGQMVGQPLKGHTHWVWSVAYSPSGTHIVSGSHDRTIRIWDARTREMAGQPLKGHTGYVMSVAYSPDGARIVSGSADMTIRIWDAHTGQMLGQPLEGHTDWVQSVAYSPDGKHVVSGSDDQSIRIWDVCALSNSGKRSPDNPDSIRQPSPPSDIPEPISSDFDTSSRIYEPRTKRGLPIRPNPSDPNAWTLREDGWVVGYDLKPLLWVPPELRDTLLRYENTCMISRKGSWALDLSKARFGTDWKQCYRP